MALGDDALLALLDSAECVIYLFIYPGEKSISRSIISCYKSVTGKYEFVTNSIAPSPAMHSSQSLTRMPNMGTRLSIGR